MNPTLRLLFLLASLALVTPPSASAIAHAEDPDTAPNAYRIILDEGSLTARALNGTPTLNQDALPETSITPSVHEEPWRGYPRTVQITLTGPGTAYLADNASGLLIHLEAPTNTTEPPTPQEDDSTSEASNQPDTPPPGSEDADPATQPADPTQVPGPTPWDAPTGAQNPTPTQANPQPSNPAEDGVPTMAWLLIGAGLLIALLVVSRHQIHHLLQSIHPHDDAAPEPADKAPASPEEVPVVYRSQADRLRGHQPPRRAPPTPTEETEPPPTP